MIAAGQPPGDGPDRDSRPAATAAQTRCLPAPRRSDDGRGPPTSRRGSVPHGLAAPLSDVRPCHGHQAQPRTAATIVEGGAVLEIEALQAVELEQPTAPNRPCVGMPACPGCDGRDEHGGCCGRNVMRRSPAVARVLQGRVQSHDRGALARALLERDEGHDDTSPDMRRWRQGALPRVARGCPERAAGPKKASKATPTTSG